MTRQRATALVLAIVCVVTWWVVAARVRAPVVSPQAGDRAPRPPAPGTLFDFEAQRQRLESSAAAVRSTRNPFSFSGPERGEADPSIRPGRGAAPDVATPPPLDLEPIPYALVGIVTRRGDDAASRVAVLSGRGQLILVARGETVASRYLVDTVSADVVELRDTATGRVVRLALR